MATFQSLFASSVDDAVPISDVTRKHVCCALQILLLRKEADFSHVPRDVLALIGRAVWKENCFRNENLKEDFSLLLSRFSELKVQYDSASEWLEAKLEPWKNAEFPGQRHFLRMIEPATLVANDGLVTPAEYNRLVRHFHSLCRNYKKMMVEGEKNLQLLDSVEFRPPPSCNFNSFWCLLACMRFSPLRLKNPPKDVRKLLYRAFVEQSYSKALMCGRMQVVAEGRGKWASASTGIPNWECILCSHHYIINCVSKLHFEKLHVDHFATHHPKLSFWDVVTDDYGFQNFERRIQLLRDQWNGVHPAVLEDVQLVAEAMGDAYSATSNSLFHIVNTYFGIIRDFLELTILKLQDRNVSCVSIIASTHSMLLFFWTQLKNDDLLNYLEEHGHSVSKLMRGCLETDLEWLEASTNLEAVYEGQGNHKKHLFNIAFANN